MMPIEKILIVGDGNWGSTIHDLLTDRERYPADKGFSYPDREVKIYGPGMEDGSVITYPSGLAKWPADALKYAEDADLLVFAVSSAYMRDTVRTFAQYNRYPETIFMNVAKGMVYDEDQKEVYFMHEILKQELNGNKNIVSLAGANIAKEIRHKWYPSTSTSIVNKEPEYNPASTTIATLNGDSTLHNLLKDVFTVRSFTVRQADPDILALELGSALKNVIAFGSGVLHGYYEERASQNNIEDPMISNILGDFIDISSVEGEYMFHKIASIKGKKKRIPYSVLGDLITTSISRNSRNFRAGFMRGVSQFRGEEKTIEDICAEIGEAVESVTTINSLKAYFQEKNWAEEHFIIFNGIYKVMQNEMHIKDVADLLAKGHPRITRLQEVMEKRAREPRILKRRTTAINRKTLEGTDLEQD